MYNKGRWGERCTVWEETTQGYDCLAADCQAPVGRQKTALGLNIGWSLKPITHRS